MAHDQDIYERFMWLELPPAKPTITTIVADRIAAVREKLAAPQPVADDAGGGMVDSLPAWMEVAGGVIGGTFEVLAPSGFKRWLKN